MKTIPVPLSDGRSHRLVVGAPLEKLGAALARLVTGRRALVVSAAPVARVHGGPLVRGLKKAGFTVSLALVPDGEQNKQLRVVQTLYPRALAAGLDRRCPVVALGGGVVGDMAGFLAATYLRGIPVVQVPTTLLAMVDSSIGGKTGVDLPEGKNLVGSFWQPALVWMDVATLRTLPDRQWRTGMAEVIKYGLIADRSLLQLVERKTLADLKGDPGLLSRLIGRSAGIKARVVSRDERESRGQREILNLGHTFGHAIETVTGYRDYTHGEAIAVGMCAAARLGAALGAFPASGVKRVDALFHRWGLPVRARRPLPRAEILRAMAKDKKTIAGRFRFVVPVGWGSAKVVADVDRTTLNTVLSAVGL